MISKASGFWMTMPAIYCWFHVWLNTKYLFKKNEISPDKLVSDIIQENNKISGNIFKGQKWKMQANKRYFQIPIPECSCIKICPRELESVVKDPHFERPLNSATWREIDAGPSNIAITVEAAAIRT